MVGEISWFGPHGWLFKDRRCSVESESCAFVGFDEGDEEATPGYVQLQDLVYSSGGVDGIRTTDTVVEVDIAFDPSRSEKFRPRIKLIRVVNPGKRLGDPM